MIPYPIEIKVNLPRKRTGSKVLEFSLECAQARKIEVYLNDQMKDRPSDTFNYRTIADAVGLTMKSVRKFLQPMEFGSGGITMYNPNLIDDDGNPIKPPDDRAATEPSLR